MLNWTCKNTVLQFNENYYTQLDGVAMGSPIAPLMADVFMNWLIDNVNKIGCSPQIICRYVDDIFCAFDSKEKMDQFFYNLSFSKEVEADGQLAYCLTDKNWERDWINYLQEKHSYRTVQ